MPSMCPLAAAMQPYINYFDHLLILLISRIAALARCGLLQTACSVVCLSVGLSVMTVSPAKVTELIVMPFGILTQLGPRNQVLHEGPDLRT